MSAKTTEELGRAAYDAYCASRDWKSYDRKPLPPWPEVVPEIRAGWVAAAEAVLAAVEKQDETKLEEPR